MNTILAQDLGDLEIPTTDLKEIEEREKSLAWTLKGIACQISHRMTHKFGNMNYTSNKEYTKKFITECSSVLLDSHLLIISKHKTHF